jgi:glycosyltransferase involved in cell wall biosynthesis
MSSEQRADVDRILGRFPAPGDGIAASVRCTFPLAEERLLRGGALDWPERPEGVQGFWGGCAFGELDTSVSAVRELLGCVDRWLAVSTHSRHALVAGGVPADRVDVLAHPVDDRLFRPGERRVGGPFMVLNVSVGHPRLKGVDVLLDAFERAFGDDPSAVLRIHQRKGAPADLGPRVRLTTGPLRQDELARLYRDADVYVQPSRAEASGLTALEAACCGTPALVTGWGGPVDYTDGVAVRPIAYRLADSEPSPLAWGSRGSWAEPDAEHLASLLVDTRAHLEERREQARAEAPRLAARFGLDAVGRRAADLLT